MANRVGRKPPARGVENSKQVNMSDGFCERTNESRTERGGSGLGRTEEERAQTYRDEFDTLAVAARDMVPEVLGMPVRERRLVIRQARHSRPGIVVRSPEEAEPTSHRVSNPLKKRVQQIQST